MEEAVPSKEAEEASDEKRHEPFFGIELSGCCEWARLWTLESFQVASKDEIDLQLILTSQG